MRSVYEIPVLIALFLYILFALFLLTHKKGNRRSNAIFAFLLFSKAFILSNFLLYSQRLIIYRYFPAAYLIVNSFFFLIGPLLYFYTRSVTDRDLRFKKIYLLHFVPALIDLLLRSLKYFATTNVKSGLIDTGSMLTDVEYYVGLITIKIHVLVYIIASLFVLKSYQSEIKKVFSSIERINLSWLKLILYGFLFLQFVDYSKYISLLITGSYAEFIGIIKDIGPLAFVTIILVKGLKQPEIFSGIHRKPKYEKSSLRESDRETSLKKLVSFMQTEKPYLIPTLTLFELAEKLSIQPRHLSQILNESIHLNFYDFINKYRIEEAKRLLLDNSASKKTVLEILYEVGFNSKSSFNSVFKKHTGMTPVQFRRMHHPSDSE